MPQLADDLLVAHANDDPKTFDVLANDTLDGYAGPGIITAVSYPTSGGAAQIADDGKSVVYRPAADFSGDDTFSYVVDNQFVARVTMQVISPLAVDEATVYPTGQPLTIDLLANDPFWSGYTGARRITAVSATSLGGSVTIGDDGRSIRYTAPTDPHAIGRHDHLTYIVDGKYAANVDLFLFDPLVASLKRVPQNGGPVELQPLAESNFDQWPAYAGPRRVTNAFGSVPGSGVAIKADGRTLIYQPAADFIGIDTVTFVVDGKFASTITVDVRSAADDDLYYVDQDDSGTTLNVLQNDYFRESNDHSIRLATEITSVSAPDQGGHVEIVQGGQSIRYTPAAGFVGHETFTYRTNGKYTASVTVDVSRPVRDDQLPQHGERIVADSQGHVLDVLANDFRRAGAHAITSVGTPSGGGSVAIQAGGQALIYTPQPGFVGTEQFTYVVDGQYSATVFVNVSSPAGTINQDLDPVAGKTYRIDPRAYLTGLAAYTGSARVTGASVGTGNAAAAVSADGYAVLVTPGDFSHLVINYTLDDKYTGTMYLSFRASRFLGSSTTVIDQNTPGRLDVLASAPWQYPTHSSVPVVYQGARLITGAFGATHGTLSVAADGKSLVYVPDADFVGHETIQYLVDGTQLGTATVQVVRRVRDDRFRVDSSSQNNVLPVVLNDQLGAGYTGLGRITHATAPEHGSVNISADGRSLVYTPDAGYTGNDSVTYTVDGHLKATVAIDVAAAADTAFPQFETLASLEAWLLENAIAQYSAYFGNPASEYPIVYYPGIGDLFTTSTAASGASASTRHSETNVQVAGVDEADLTETDDEFLYVLSGGKLVIARALAGDELAVVSETPVTGSIVGMYLAGDRLTVVSQTGLSLYDPWGFQAWLRYPRHYTQTTVTVFDVANRAQPQVVQTTEIDGTHFDSRKIGDFVYLVLNGQGDLALPAPEIVDDPQVRAPSDEGGGAGGRYETQEEYTRRIHDHFGEILESILPQYRSYRPDGSLIRSGVLLTPEEIGRPLDDSDRSLLSVVTIDTTGNEPGIVAATGIVSDAASELFMNRQSMYLLRPSHGGENETTAITKFAFDETTGRVVPVASGQVPGHVLDQFSVDEFDGDLRLATTVLNGWADNWSGVAENDVWVVRQDGTLLELIGGLQNLAHGESIRSVRYDDQRVVITAFPTAQIGIDPVYAIDLADPTAPKFVGELTLPGFNQYMQFVDDTHVLAVGTSAPTAAGMWSLGLPMHVSLFDVADFAHPRLVDQYTLPRFSTSLAQRDHHAFGWFAELGMLALPVGRSYTRYEDLDGDGYREARTTVDADEVLYFRIHTDTAGDADRAVELLGTIVLDAAALRTAFVGDTLFAIGDGQIVASAIDDPGTPLGSVTWDVPPVVGYPGGIVPIEWTFIEFPPSIDGPFKLPGVAEAGSPSSQQARLTAAVDAARANLAARLHVSPASALVVSIESPAPAESGATGPKFVLRSGETLALYRMRPNGTVELVDADFQFPRDSAPSTDVTPTPDVNRDGQVSSLDVLQVINDLIAHGGYHRVGDAVLRQIVGASSIAMPDVNHDNRITRLDLLLVINELIQRNSVAAMAANSAANLPWRAAVAAANHTASALTMSQTSAQSVSESSAVEGWRVAAPSTPLTPSASSPVAQIESGAPTTPGRVGLTTGDLAFALTDDWSLLDDELELDDPAELLELCGTG